MNIKQTLYTHGAGLMVIASLMVLSGCDLKNKFCGSCSTSSSVADVVEYPTDGSMVLISMDSKPLVTQKSLEIEKNDLLDANPQLKSMIMYMDSKQLDRNIAEGLASQAIVDRYVKEHAIDQRADYQQDLKRMLRSVKQMLNTKYFTQAFPVAVTDAEIQAFYDNNKDRMPHFLISRGGTKAMGISFDKEQDAKDFLAKAKAQKGDIKKAAQAANLTDKITDFKVVSDQSIGIDNDLKNKIIAMKVPSLELFKINDKTFWVVNSTGKEENKYRPLDQIKGDIRQLLEKEKNAEHFDQEIGRLREEYKVTMNDEFFKDQKEEEALGENIPGMEQEQMPTPAEQTSAAPVNQMPRAA